MFKDIRIAALCLLALTVPLAQRRTRSEPKLADDNR